MKRLLESIRKHIDENKRGNIEPIIITQGMTIISGHQRVRAFNELKIPTIEAEIRIYKSEDDVLLDLLESNIRRSGEIGGSAKKVGKRIKELERLYGFEKGGNHGNQYTVPKEKIFTLPKTSDEPTTQSDLATTYGITKQTMNNYMRLAKAIPELEDLVDTGIVTTHTALAMMRNLSPGELIYANSIVAEEIALENKEKEIGR